MLELRRFRESYFRGSLLWVKGTEAVDRIEITRNLLRLCGVEDDQVKLVSWFDFLQNCETVRGKTLVLHDLDDVDECAWKDLSKQFRHWQQRLRFTDEIRLILVSSDESLRSKEDDLSSLNPVMIHLNGEGNAGFGLDEWLHGLLEKASLAAKKPILRVSERVAAFFESTDLDWNDDELLDLLILAAGRSKGGILRLSDLFPPKTRKGASLSVS